VDQLGLVGYRLLGRYGDLGIVEGESSAGGELMLVVRGGVSRALVFHVPMRRTLDVSAQRRTVTVDVDVADFVPSLGDDGTVVLELTQ
jgi:hypothetical protein